MPSIKQQMTILMVLSLLVLNSCGGGSEEPETPEKCFQSSVYYCPSSVWGDPFGIALVFAWYSGQCSREVGCVEDLPPTDASQGIITEGFIQENWVILDGTDIEPNDDFDTAQPLVLNAESVYSQEGVINDATDQRDMIAVGFQSNNLHAIYICRGINDCLLPFYSGDEVHIEFYDQNRNLIQSSEMNLTSNGHEITFTPTIGLYYYVAIVADNTGGSDYAYEMAIAD